jgi:hypothetical protein
LFFGGGGGFKTLLSKNIAGSTYIQYFAMNGDGGGFFLTLPSASRSFFAPAKQKGEAKGKGGTR